MRPEKLQSLTDYIRCTTRRRIKTDGYIRQYPGKRPSTVLFNTHVFYFPAIDLNKFKRFFTLKLQKIACCLIPFVRMAMGRSPN